MKRFLDCVTKILELPYSKQHSAYFISTVGYCIVSTLESLAVFITRPITLPATAYAKLALVCTYTALGLLSAEKKYDQND